MSPLIFATYLAIAQPPAPFELKDGDRVVFLGNALIEYEQFHGYLETMLLRHAEGKKIRFRNLGWSGDTVRGNARTSGYQNPDGMARLLREVKLLEPTVLVVGYGMNESFAGPTGLPEFVQGFNKLLDDLASLQARIMILSPTPHEDLGRPLPDPSEHNRSLQQYVAALKKAADQRKARFVDLYEPLQHLSRATSYTTNGILLNDLGYRTMAGEIERQLGFASTDIDGTGALRRAIVKRNELFYRRWRPFNDHSRHWGFMAKDFQLYDDEVTAQERVIERLRTSGPEGK